MVKIETSFSNFYSKESTLETSLFFEHWEEAKTYLEDRILLKREKEYFVILIGEKRFVEVKKNRFLSLQKIEEEFFLLKKELKNVAAKKGNLSRIEIRLNEKLKREVLNKSKKLGINVSEFTRQFYEHGEILIVPDQVKRDIRGMAINLNQIAKRVNSGAVGEQQVITELRAILDELKKMYKR